MDEGNINHHNDAEEDFYNNDFDTYNSANTYNSNKHDNYNFISRK